MGFEVAEKKLVTMLIDIGSSCNILQKSYCRKHGLVVHPCEKKLTGFNGSTITVWGMIDVLVNIWKWRSLLLLYVLDYGAHPIIDYSGLKNVRLSINFVLDNLVGDDGDRVL